MPHSRKRKREHVKGGDDDDGDDTTYGLRQILPVANLPIDFDGEPTDGMQYLFTVRYVLSITLSRGSRIG
jgi:Survival motor neuron (SMN) interacting protein 1 (SIP1)